jgi:hypothetical protein
MRAADHLVVTSHAERERLGRTTVPVSVIPATVQDGPQPPPAADRDRLLFVGTLFYQPNVEAVRFLVQEVLPRVRAARPGTELDVVGRRPIDEVLELCRAPGVRLAATSPRSSRTTPPPGGGRAAVDGGGTRVKIVEALPRRAAIVATTLAVRGIDLGPDAVLTADDADAFAAHCVRLLDEPELAERLGRRRGRPGSACTGQSARSRPSRGSWTAC